MPYPMPEPPPMLTTRIVHSCREIGGDRDHDLALGFRQEGWKWGADDHLEPRWIDLVPWPEIRSLTVDSRESTSRRAPFFLSVPFGRLNRRAQPRRHTYLIIELAGGTRTFRVNGMSVDDLRQHLLPVTDWLDQHRQQLQLAAAD
jgi:hypothetical protein